MEGVDFGDTVADYSTYGAGFPSSFFAELEQRGVPMRGMRAVDPWTGTGTVTREFVISGASTVIGIDAAESITREARKLDETAGGYVEYLNTTAEATGLP